MKYLKQQLHPGHKNHPKKCKRSKSTSKGNAIGIGKFSKADIFVVNVLLNIKRERKRFSVIYVMCGTIGCALD